jgi:hypothetical protein
LKWDSFRIKHHIIKCLHKIARPQKFSTSFFYKLACDLTSSFAHSEFNIDAHTLPFCSTPEQIQDLLSRWSLSRFEQINKTSPLSQKLIHYQPRVTIELLQNGLASKYGNDDELESYIRDNRDVFLSLVEQQPKAMCCFTIKHLKQLNTRKRILPDFIQQKQKRLFDKAPAEMIELISLVAAHEPGQ